MQNQLILVLNCGSSSFKFSIINPSTSIVYLSGVSDNFYSNNTLICLKQFQKEIRYIYLKKYMSYKNIIKEIFKILLVQYKDYMNNVVGIGHRVVHGGDKIKSSVIINNTILDIIKENSIFAPIHNPINLLGIQIALILIPHLKSKNIAVFDTVFHHTIPQYSYLYGIPYYFYEYYSLRRYGAHGINHYYVSKVSAVFLKKQKNLNIISCHLGSGSSVTAIVRGQSIDTSMGLTPLEGLIMGTRCGNLDPSIIIYMSEVLHLKISVIKKILNEESGILGINKISSDFRILEKLYYQNKMVKLSIKMYCYHLAKYISSYTVCMKGRLDAIIFTGGIGENSHLVRKNTIDQLSLLNLIINNKRNLEIHSGRSGFINASNSLPIIVIPANENQIIAEDTLKLVC
ncbi:acetate kinase [Buchnera aphidicola (Cinara tujafilina)]|uniref:Acetate kinase n=1 Tax=Buchnera aphidicola (Cinara tujafilina) TaxID=261317 RepID=F7WZT7_9GAMM|nr:acetate/propionate family kinase [Buchnera aphidicola]AEH39709.1 acetate kinase [Buchnera aphidicola (Cinara tujafilina)]